MSEGTSLSIETIAVVMARGGSKRLPGKNIKQFMGFPAVAWPVRVALDSGGFSSVIISTDDDEIAEAACCAGAKRPFVRPPELANDYASTLDVVRHALKSIGVRDGLCCCLYGTSLFATPELLSEGGRMIRDDAECEAVMCAVRFEHPPQRGFSISEDGRASFLNDVDFSARTQDLPAIYHDVGLFYWFRIGAVFDTLKRSLSDFTVRPLVLPRGTVVDIDTEDDWNEAERIVANAKR